MSGNSGADLTSMVDQLSSARVLCVGDVMLDRFVSGVVERVSPEAPVPVLRVQREEKMLGGAGNVARNVATLGGQAFLLTVVGDDDAGRLLAQSIKELPGLDGELIIDASRPTTEKIRYVAAGQQLLRADDEVSVPVDGAVSTSLVSSFEARLADCDVVVLSDYAKGVLTDRLLAELISAARAVGKIVVADPKSRNLKRYAGVDILTPNRLELAHATGHACADDQDIEAAGAQIVGECDVGALLVTRGDKGMTLLAQDVPAVHLGAQAREVYDVSGAGDTVVATLACSLAAGYGAEQAARLANQAAGIVVGKVGTAAIYARDLAAESHRLDLLRAGVQVVTLSAACDHVSRWREQGNSVGFTNGCFDLLHPGHIHLLKQAAAACDRLVVGLNSDASVRELKGEGRPVQNEAARSTVLASLEMVDLVIIFSEETPIELIRALQPDVLIKGADYQIDTVVGADLVQEYGGRILLAELAPGHSTTATLERLNEPD